MPFVEIMQGAVEGEAYQHNRERNEVDQMGDV